MNGNPLINETLLQMKYARVISLSLLAKKLAVPEDKAMAVLRNPHKKKHRVQKIKIPEFW